MSAEEGNAGTDAQGRAGFAALWALAAFAAAIFAIHFRLAHLSMHTIYAHFSGLAVSGVVIGCPPG